MIVYKSTCTINNKCYIGVTTQSLSNRIYQHRHSCMCPKYKFHKALKKYGFDNFIWDIIDTAYNIDDLYEKEVFYISFYDSIKNGYNTTPGGAIPPPAKGENNGMYGKSHTDAVKNRLSDLRTGVSWNDFLGKEGALAAKEKLRKAHTGRKNTPQTIQKMKQNSYWKNNGHLIIGELNPNYGNKWTEEMKDRCRGENNPMYGKGYLLAGENNGMYGKHHTPEARKAMSDNRKGRKNANYRKMTEETRGAMIQLFKKNQSVSKTATFIGENYNKVKRELVLEGLIDKNFREKKYERRI